MQTGHKVKLYPKSDNRFMKREQKGGGVVIDW